MNDCTVVVILVLALVGVTVVEWAVEYTVIGPALYFIGEGIVKVVKQIRRKG